MRIETDLREDLLILPGLMCDAGMFAATLAAFPQARAIDDHYRGADTIGTMAEHVLASAPASFALIGHSMGARVALAVAARAPDRVTRLMIADTGVHAVREGEADSRHALRDLGRREGFDRLVDVWLPPMVGEAARTDAALMASLRTMCLRAGQAVFEAQTHALLHRPDTAAVLLALTCPVAVVVGTEDQWSSVAQHEAIAARIAGATLHVIAGSGHMAPAEQPEAFNTLIREWLDVPAIPSTT
ncbi:alpha/beta hydrolase [Sphingomonas sp.]|uniref:alpha/beta fold hydrolase n=1 Tax=Sphingomonas sp. TaxID=28214 RepID=UPI00180C7357|nr:alpha/beta hydrolase [Sphingomonas sp.]MBA4761657.1 alpha/beta fold hydrolase [Sphingomonas sp.]